MGPKVYVELDMAGELDTIFTFVCGRELLDKEMLKFMSYVVDVAIVTDPIVIPFKLRLRTGAEPV